MTRVNRNEPLFVKIPCDSDRVVPYFKNSSNGHAWTHDTDIKIRGVDICGLSFFLLFSFIASSTRQMKVIIKKLQKLRFWNASRLICSCWTSTSVPFIYGNHPSLSSSCCCRSNETCTVMSKHLIKGSFLHWTVFNFDLRFTGFLLRGVHRISDVTNQLGGKRKRTCWCTGDIVTCRPDACSRSSTVTAASDVRSGLRRVIHIYFFLKCSWNFFFLRPEEGRTGDFLIVILLPETTIEKSPLSPFSYTDRPWTTWNQKSNLQKTASRKSSDENDVVTTSALSSPCPWVILLRRHVH